MCTGLSYKNGDHYFGRNLDLDCNFGEQVVITPRNYPLTYKAAEKHEQHYAMIGMAVVIDDYPLYAEAINEKGLGMAGLNFPGYAQYNKQKTEGSYNVTPYEIIPWTLAQFETISEVKKAYEKLNLVEINFKEGIPIAPLHWIIADSNNDSIVLECSNEGIKVYDNPVGVMTNNPTFDFHLTNLRNYRGISTTQPDNKFSKNMDLPPFGQGLGGFGLPGDFSPTSRFVKAAFLKENSSCPQDESSNVAQFFHILDAVAMVRGAVVTPQNKEDVTLYSCCANTNTGDFYYKTYNNNQINLVSMSKENLDSNELISYPMKQEQQFQKIN